MKFLDRKTRVRIAEDGKVIYLGAEEEEINALDVEIFLIGEFNWHLHCRFIICKNQFSHDSFLYDFEL